MQSFGDILAEEIEEYDTTIDPLDFKTRMERALKRDDPEDYELHERGNSVPMKRLYVLDVMLRDILPAGFMEQLKEVYKMRK